MYNFPFSRLQPDVWAYAAQIVALAPLPYGGEIMKGNRCAMPVDFILNYMVLIDPWPCARTAFKLGNGNQRKPEVPMRTAKRLKKMVSSQNLPFTQQMFLCKSLFLKQISNLPWAWTVIVYLVLWPRNYKTIWLLKVLGPHQLCTT